jgi:polysaccharide biosynthesis protein PslJ
VMLAVMAVFLLVNHWTAFVRVLLVAVPLVLVGALALPGSVGSLLMNFLQPDELIASQYASAGSRGSGRLADLGPSLAAAQAHLPFGTGVGSRVVSGEGVNAPILDDQYLSTLLESGLLGLIAMVALLLTPVVVLLRRTRDPYLHGPERDLALALSCAFAGYAVAAVLFDAFAFQQTLMIFFLLLGVASWLVATADARAGQVRQAGVPTETPPVPAA